MNVTLLVTKTDFSLHNLENELDNIGIAYQVKFIEDCPDLVATNRIMHSPNVLVDDELIFRSQPSPQELKDYFCH